MAKKRPTKAQREEAQRAALRQRVHDIMLGAVGKSPRATSVVTGTWLRRVAM